MYLLSETLGWTFDVLQEVYQHQAHMNALNVAFSYFSLIRWFVINQ